MIHKRLVALIAMGATMLMGLALAGPAMASTTDSCVELGPGPIGAQSCFAVTSERDVVFAQVHVGKYSVGTFTLVCTDRWNNRFVKQGNIGRNGTRSFFPEALFNLRRPTCTLGVHATNFAVNRRAAGSVLLISG
jgi:hypothetical protein